VEATITGIRFVGMELLSTVFSAMRCADCGKFSSAFGKTLRKEGLYYEFSSL